jgi:hypothetical protein
MKLSGWPGLVGLILSAALFIGCLAPPSAAEPPLTAAAVQHTLDSWNPSYCKVAELYGLYQPDPGGASQVAYAAILNPGNAAQKPLIYAATFQLLTRPDGVRQWYLTSLLTHGQGLFVKRQGWDNLLVPVQEVSPKP